jgi:hypothetical protein
MRGLCLDGCKRRRLTVLTYSGTTFESERATVGESSTPRSRAF